MAKKNKIYMIVAVAVVLILIVIFLFLRGSEDSWIKDERGVWIKHGNPSTTPDYVSQQQDAIVCALQLYNEAKQQGTQFSSQCLGTCENYVVDIVHVPRVADDNLVENQCQDYREGKIKHFIELDKDGNLVKVV